MKRQQQQTNNYMFYKDIYQQIRKWPYTIFVLSYFSYKTRPLKKARKSQWKKILMSLQMLTTIKGKLGKNNITFQILHYQTFADQYCWIFQQIKNIYLQKQQVSNIDHWF